MLLAAWAGGAATVGIPQPNTRSDVEVAKPQTFNGEAEKVSGFLMACRLYIEMRIRNIAVEE